MKLKLFSDKIGRIICGELITQTPSHVVVKNPVICNLIQQDQNTPPQISILPYVFLELFDMQVHNDYEVAFNVADITDITSVNGGDLNNIHPNFVSNYTALFERIRNIKNQPQQQATAPAEAQSNVVEVK